MRKFLVVTLGFILAVSASLFVACTPIPESSSSESSKEESSNPIITTYEVAYGAGGALGEAPATQTVEEGTVITLIENPFTNEGYTFKGWLLGETLYQAGDSFTVNENATFVASWEEIVYNPHFLQESYAYDRWAAGDLELTLDLDRTNLIYVEINGEMLFSSDYSYDSEKQCLVIVEDVMLTLVDGEYSVIVYTDAAKAENPTCTVIVDNSVKTSFDETTLKTLRYGYENGVTFAVEYNGCTVKEIKRGESVVPAEYYEVSADGFTVKAEYLKYFCGETAFSVVLTNNDVYGFAINSNVLFATDYDINTIHNTTQSNVGHNPLYQYSDNVSIEEAPLGMSGKALKVTPNTGDVQYDCNGYITLASLEYKDTTTWYNVGFVPGKLYAVSFDYLTEGTSTGTFTYKDPHSGWSKNLLLGAENDGVVHNFKAIIKGDELKHGLCIYAKFTGGGVFYVDNFRVVELEALPTLSDNGNYNLIGDYTFNFDAAGLKYEVKLAGEPIETVYDANAKTLTIKSEIAELLEAGAHTLTVETAFGVLEATMRVVDNRVAILTANSAEYKMSKQDEVVLHGSFTEGLKLTSLRVKDKLYDDGYSGGWDFYHADESIDYSKYASLVCGLDGSGKLIIAGELIDMFWGETTFVAEISNGASIEFTINNVEVIFNTNYDALMMKGWLGDFEHPGSPMSSGMSGTQAVQERADGKGKALFFTGTENSADRAALTLKFTNHVWAWYYLYGSENNMYRITFEYQISNLAENSIFFFILLPNGLDIDTLVLGDYDEVVQQPDWQEVRYYLNNDGEVHTFDSGWFGYNHDVVNLKIQLPEYATGSGSYFMLDTVKVFESADILKDLADYQLNQADEYGFIGDGTTVLSVKVDGNVIAHQVVEGRVVLDKEALNLLSVGSHVMIVETAKSTYRATFLARDDSKAEASELTHSYIYNTSDLVVEGTFKLVEITGAYLSCDAIVFDEGDYDYDQIKNAPVSINYITMSEDKLVISKELLDKCYGEATLSIHFSNGDVVNLIIYSNVAIFCDYDTTHFNMPLGSSINGYISQDSASMSVATDEKGNKFLRYCINDCQQGHAVNSGYNYIYIFNTNWGPLGYYIRALDASSDWMVSFDYKVVNTAGNDLKYYFITADHTETGTKHYLSGNSGTFSMKIIGGDTSVSRFAIGCDLSAAADCYLAIDNYRIVAVEKAKTYDYVYGSSDLVINGSFANKSVASVARRNSGYFAGSHQFDSSPASVDSKYFTVNGASLVISKTLLDMFYGTTNLIVTFTDGSDFELNVKSNSVYFTNFDETFLHMPFTTEGGINGYITQDSAQLKLYDDNGNHSLRYCTAEAYHGHALTAPWNFVMLFNTTWSGKGDYCQIMESGKTYAISFDYVIVNAENQELTYSFVREDSAGQHTREAISSTAGTFTTTIQARADVHRIAISTDQIGGAAGCYMLIDNYRITEIA